MAQRPKAKPKRKSPKDIKGKDEKQSARFIEMARTLGVDESGKSFERRLNKLLKPPANRSRPSGKKSS
jgi:hypothetical protein